MKKIIALLLAIIVVIGLAGCNSATGKLEKIQKAGKIVLYTDPNFAPFEFKDNGNEIVGVDIEIAKAIAEKLGATLEIKEAGFDSILMAIKGGKGDIAISGFTITPDRQKSVDFSTPYINSVQYLILPLDTDITNFESLAGKKVAVAKGYTGSLLMDYEMGQDEEYTGILFGKNTDCTEYPSALEATTAMLGGKADAVVMDEYVAKKIASTNDKVKIVELAYADGTVAEEEYGVAVAKGNEDLLAIINEVLASLVLDKITGWVVDYSIK